MRYLALDIGTRRTGVAYADEESSIPFPLDTIEHETFDVLEDAVASLIDKRSINQVIIGLPLLPSGEEGKQAKIVRSFTERLGKRAISFEFVDERYSTPRGPTGDGDAAAAFQILSTFLAQKSI